jgi:hypothetical protein
MKRKRLIGLAVAAGFVLLAAGCLWGPGSAPRGEAPVVTLSEGNLGEFEKAFDAETSGGPVLKAEGQVSKPKFFDAGSV